MRNKKFNLLDLRRYRENWKEIKTELWLNDKRNLFVRRKKPWICILMISLFKKFLMTLE